MTRFGRFSEVPPRFIVRVLVIVINAAQQHDISFTDDLLTSERSPLTWS